MTGFLGQNWGAANLRDKLKGLLADPNQMLTNPMFGAGMGILSETGKPFGGDPFGAAMGGMMNAKQMQVDEDERERLQKARDEIAKLLASLGVPPGGAGASGGVPGPGGMPGTPPAVPPPIPPGTPMVGPPGAQVPAAGSRAAAAQMATGPGNPQNLMSSPHMQQLIWDMALGRNGGR